MRSMIRACSVSGYPPPLNQFSLSEVGVWVVWGDWILPVSLQNHQAVGHLGDLASQNAPTSVKVRAANTGGSDRGSRRRRPLRLCPRLQGWCLSSPRRDIDKSHRDTIQRITTSKRRRCLDARPFLHVPEPGKIGCPPVRHLRCGCMKIRLAVRRHGHTLRRDTPLRRQDHRDGEDHAACCHDFSCQHRFLLLQDFMSMAESQI